jgi:DNA sulfur modification protein DndD
MIFNTITIKDLFSYYGEQTFDFSQTPESEGNIVIIQGRNGQGKTSFINAVKLLFMGPANELLRQVTTAKDRIPTLNQYILGADGWWGIMNARARQNQTECWISAVWEDEYGQVTAKRHWQFHPSGGYTETVSVDAPLEGELDDQAARAYLERTLPREYVPFFFFDGEEVRELAESNTNETIAKMESLLNIRPLDNLKFGLNELRKRWHAQAASEQHQRDYVHKQNHIENLDADIAVEQESLHAVVADLDEENDRLARLKRQLNVLQGSDQKEDAGRLKERVEQLAERRSEQRKAVSEQFQRDAFLRLTPTQMTRAITTTEACAHGEAAGQAELIATLKHYLPQVFSKPPYPVPPLTDAQIAFYRRKLLKELDVYDIAADHAGPFCLDPSRARQLLTVLSVFDTQSQPASELIRQVENVRQLGLEIDKLDARLANVTHLSEARQQEYQRLFEESEQVRDRIQELETKRRGQDAKLRQLYESRAKSVSELESLGRNLENARTMRSKVDLIRQLMEATNRVKQALKRIKREELEEAYNAHLHRLLDSTHLIDRVRIDDDFVISYLDKSGQIVPMGSISAGMKQLSATSLLWALKEVSGRDIPVIVDTPLGRIDLGHQHNLLTDYYPNVGRQVIVLPTDSELTPDKYALIARHVYRQYQLSYSSDQGTQIQRIEIATAAAQKELGLHG